MGILKTIGKGPVGLDTCIFIYFLEEDPRYIESVMPIFEAVDERKISGVTSGITLLELLVIPLRNRDFKLARQYHQFLVDSVGLSFCDLDQELLYRGALLRAELGLKTADALQIAAAQMTHCTSFITNDRRFPRIEGLTILQLSDCAAY